MSWRAEKYIRAFIAILAIIVFIFAVAIVGIQVNAKEWKWAPKSDKHDAACMVNGIGKETNGGMREMTTGSGAYISSGNMRAVLTAFHNVRGAESVIVTFSDGVSRKTPNWTSCKFGNDIAIVFVKNDDVLPLAISDIPPVIGDKLEVVPFSAGGGSLLRAFTGTVTNASASETFIDSYVANGCSGSGVLNSNGNLVGVQIAGRQLSAIGVYRGTISTGFRPTIDFIRRVRAFADRMATGRPQRKLVPVVDGCGPIGCPSPFYPPAQKAPSPYCKPAPAPKRWISPPSQPRQQIAIDYKKLAAAIIEKAGIERIRGPVGPQGSPGRDGAIGQAGLEGQPGSAGPQGEAGSDADIDTIVDQVKRKLRGSMRVKVTPAK